MKRRLNIFVFLLIALVPLVSSCMQTYPSVSVIVSKWDNDSHRWVEFQGQDANNILDKKYVYGQRFSAEIPGNSFTEVVGPVDPNDSSKGNIIRTYTFDGKTWSYDRKIGAQTRLENPRLEDSVNELYAYYETTDAPESSFAWSWELVDPARYIYPVDGYEGIYSYYGTSQKYDVITIERENEYNITENASLTKGLSKPITGKGRTVTGAPFPTRRGYKFKGWSTRTFMETYNNGSQPLFSPAPEYPAASSFTLEFEDGYIKGNPEEKTTLYAVWVPDLENGYWAKVDNTYVPDTFNYKDLDNMSHITRFTNQDYFTDYPYYNEVQYPSKGLVSPWASGVNVSNTYTFDYDFAMADTEFTAYTLEKLKEWNNTLEYEERFSLPNYPSGTVSVGAGSNTTAYPYVPTDEKNFLSTGFTYNGSYAQWSYPYDYSISNPLASVHIYQAYIIANAMTAYYNAHNGNGDDLTYAYRNEDDTPVRTIEEAALFYSRFTRVQYGSRGDLTSTGFRLPTVYEWQFAARVMPYSKTSPWMTENQIRWQDTGFKGSSYPQFQMHSMPSGACKHVVKNYEIASNPATSTASENVWSLYSSSSNTDRTYGRSRGFFYDGAFQHGTTLTKPANYSGIYNMSGNVHETLDSMAPTTDSEYVIGGSAKHSINDLYVTNMQYYTVTSRGSLNGMRLCRTIKNLK